METKDRIKKVISTTFKIDEVSDKLSQNNCVQWDSLKHLNLVVELEDEFNISIEPEEIGEMKSFTDIERIILGKL